MALIARACEREGMELSLACRERKREREVGRVRRRDGEKGIEREKEREESE